MTVADYSVAIPESPIPSPGAGRRAYYLLPYPLLPSCGVRCAVIPDPVEFLTTSPHLYLTTRVGGGFHISHFTFQIRLGCLWAPLPSWNRVM